MSVKGHTAELDLKEGFGERLTALELRGVVLPRVELPRGGVRLPRGE